MNHVAAFLGLTGGIFVAISLMLVLMTYLEETLFAVKTQDDPGVTVEPEQSPSVTSGPS